MATTGSLEAWEWFGRRTYHHARFGDLSRLVEAKRASGLSVSVCVPTLNEAGTVGDVVRQVRASLVEEVPLVDEVVAIDSQSSDATVEEATAAGAVVYQDREILPELEAYGGKGDALWKSLFVLRGDVLVFIDADIRNFHPRFVYGLLGPLLMEGGVHYVKGFYERPIQEGDELAPTGGGRVTELVARPLVNMFFPSLAAVIQPLSGEYAGRREVFESVPFFTGYGVEFGLLVDVCDRVGLDGLAQVDLERRVHRNQSVPELSRMAFGVLQTALRRLVSQGRLDPRTDLGTVMYQFRARADGYEPDPSVIDIRERPPAVSVPGYRAAGRDRAAGP